MNVSINTAVFLKEIDSGENQLSCLKRLQGLPISNIEVRGEMFQEDTKDEEMKQICLLCADNNWKYFYSIPDELFKLDHVNEQLGEYLNMAEKYHIDQLKISLGNMEKISDQQLTELSKQLDAAKVIVTVENQPNENGTIDKIKNGLERLKNFDVPVGFTFDSGNWYWIFETPTNAFNELHDKITVFHLKDIKNKQTVMLDNGATDWRTIVKKLHDDIPIFLEYEIPGSKLNDQIKQVNQLFNSSVAEL